MTASPAAPALPAPAVPVPARRSLRPARTIRPGPAHSGTALTGMQRTVLLSVALGEARTARRWGYDHRDLTAYAAGIGDRLGAHTQRWEELVYLGVDRNQIPAWLPPTGRATVGLDQPLTVFVSGLAAGQQPSALAEELGLSDAERTALEKRLLARVAARTRPHAVYLAARFISWPWGPDGAWKPPTAVCPPSRHSPSPDRRTP